MRKVYCSCDSNFKSYYKNQAGSGFSDIEIFRGYPYQRGYGIGSIFSRFGIPILKYLGKHVLKTGMNVGQDILDKKNIKESLKQRSKEGIITVAKGSLAKANQLIEQKGSGIKRKRLYKNKKRVNKRIKKDIFG